MALRESSGICTAENLGSFPAIRSADVPRWLGLGWLDKGGCWLAVADLLSGVVQHSIDWYPEIPPMASSLPLDI